MHPFQAHRQSKVERSRVGSLTKGYAAGGAVSSAAVGGAPSKKAIAQRDGQAVGGDPTRQRLDRPLQGRARGGRTGKHKGTHVNVIVAPQGGANAPTPGVAAPPPMAGAGPMPAPPPRPPVPMPPPGAVPPPGIRHSGGRAYARGGAVKPGPAWNQGLKSGTQVQHTSNKQDGPNIGRKKPVTYKTGGAVEHPVKGGMAPNLHAGSGGGQARLIKAHAKHGGYRI